jgi:predicted AAA+ superfamily ATPase
MRYLAPSLKKDLQKKMVFLGGPRQCGKTTLAKAILKDDRGLYLNWDRIPDQKAILNEAWTDQDSLIVLDEIHKYPKWKNLVKGYYDTSGEKHRFLVTGSARLDVYRRGGDSLLGRYHYWRLHPFTLHEPIKGIHRKEAFERLITYGGFPEPFLDANPVEGRRWREERHERIIRDDIRDLENVKKIQLMGLLLQLLRERVGGPINVLNLATDLQVSPATVRQWIDIFERMYLIFVVRPYSRNLPRSLVKPFKIYFYDNADVIGDEGARFENLVATHLLKELNFMQDSRGERWELHYVRDKEGHEVDFVLVCDRKVVELIEAKWSDPNPSKSLIYFGEKIGAPRITQMVGSLKSSYTKNRLTVIHPIERFQSLA